jgi:uncharacterized protein (DUF305 family)
VTRLVKILVAALVGALVLGGVGALPAGAESPAPDRGTARYEVDFLTGMIDHHGMAVHMSEMCVEKAVHEELRTLCEQIVAAQSSEIEMMQSWLQDWYGVSHEPSMPPGHMQKMDRMGEMDPAEFEVEFMEMMIRHHRQAIREASGCIDRALHEELVDMCENIIETQAAEIETMQTWLCEWYDRCHGRREAA